MERGVAIADCNQSLMIRLADRDGGLKHKHRYRHGRGHGHGHGHGHRRPAAVEEETHWQGKAIALGVNSS